MFSHKFVPVESTADKKEVAWHNLCAADKDRDHNLMNMSVVGYFKSHGNVTYQDLETEFRKRNFHAHVIAIQPSIPLPENGPYRLGLPDDSGRLYPDFVLEAIVHVGHNPQQALLKEWESYEENFKALRFAGCFCSTEKSTGPKVPEEDLDWPAVCKNAVRAEPCNYSPEEQMEIMRLQIIKERNNPNITLKQIEVLPNNVPLAALVCEGEEDPVCNTGIMYLPSGPQLVTMI